MPPPSTLLSSPIPVSSLSASRDFISPMGSGFEVFLFCNSGGFLVAVAASFLVSGYSGLYAKQKFAFSKMADATGTIPEEESIHRT